MYLHLQYHNLYKHNPKRRRVTALITYITVFVMLYSKASVAISVEDPNMKQTFVPISLGDIFFVVPVIINLPPDPQELGQQTIAGVDTDNDGVRDDMEIYIANKYPNSKPAREAMYQLDKNLQNLIIFNQSSVSAIQYSLKIKRAIDCIHYRESIIPETSSAIDDIIATHLNTLERFTAYNQVEKLLVAENFSYGAANPVNRNNCEYLGN